MLLHFPVTAKHGQKIEIFAASRDFETNSSGAVPLVHDFPITQHSVHQVYWRVIENYRLDLATEDSLQFILHPRRGPAKRGRRGFSIEQTDIDVACAAASLPGDTAEQINGYQILRLSREVLPDRRDDLTVVHMPLS